MRSASSAVELKKICVLGLGYIGLPTAAVFATHGFQVIGVDVNERVVEALNNGQVHVDEPGLKTLVQASLKSGNLYIDCQPQPVDAFIIAVPTPLSAVYTPQSTAESAADGLRPTADLSYVIAAAESIVPYLRPGNLVVLESTVPPQTTVDILLPILERSGLTIAKAADDGQPTRDILVAHCPERVLPGRILKELVHNDRVIGGVNQASAEAAKTLYASFVEGEIFFTDATTAEMVKLMENTYRDVNIAIANEFSQLADRFGVNVWEAIEIANRHPRVNILRPGPGVGGHCISVDPWFFVEAAPDLTPLIRTARQVNDAQPRFVLDLVRRASGELSGKRVAVLGLAYKPDVDDLRESPAIEVARILQEEGALVRAFEPFKLDAQIPNVLTVPTLEAALEEADLLLLLVGHRQFRELDPAQVATLTPARLAVDTVNGWEAGVWETAGFRVCYLGVGESRPVKESPE